MSEIQRRFFSLEEILSVSFGVGNRLSAKILFKCSKTLTNLNSIVSNN